MIRAIISNGAILPLDPLPEGWSDGEELVIDRFSPPATETVDELDAWEASMESLAARIPAEDFDALDAALAEADEQAKAIVRREMGL